MGTYHLWRSILVIFNGASEHFGKQVAGSKVYSAYLRKSFVVIFTQSEVTKTIIQQLFHLLLILNAAARIIEETFVKRYSGIPVPPRWMEYYIYGKGVTANLYHSQA